MRTLFSGRQRNDLAHTIADQSTLPKPFVPPSAMGARTRPAREPRAEFRVSLTAECEWQSTVIEGIRCRQIAALGELYDRCAPLVYGLATRITGSQAAAENVTQNLFEDCWHEPDTLTAAGGTLQGRLAALATYQSVLWRHHYCHIAAS